MKRMKKMKRILAIVLVAAIFLSSHAQVSAATDQKMSVGDMPQEKLNEIWEKYGERINESEAGKDTAHYMNLISGSGIDDVDDLHEQAASLAYEAASYAADLWNETAAHREIGTEYINILKKFTDDARNDIIDKAIELETNIGEYSRTANALGKLSDFIKGFLEIAGAVTGILDAVSLIPDMLKLQGETLEDQILELVVLTAQFGIAAASIVGASLSFPWGLLLGVLMEMILNMIREGDFDNYLFRDQSSRNAYTYNAQRYKLPNLNNVYKPNIYIYSQETRNVEVTFGAPELLTTTIPEYGSGWSVTADENGRLTDETGQTWDYLFYESVTDPSLFQTESGWRIPADTRKETFETILSDLGFNEQEIADFTEFWTEKLEEGTDYIMYPQSTETVDQAMPMTVTDEPESVERIWFVFAEDDGSQIEEPVGYALTRGGEDCPYYVIEWGGLFLEE